MTEATQDAYPRVTLTRGPIVSAAGALNNEAVPAIGLAYIAGTAEASGYEVTIVDAIAEGLNQVHQLEQWEGYITQGLSLPEFLARIPEDSDVIGFSAMFSGEWPVVRETIKMARRKFPDALFVAGGEHITALPEYSLRDCPEIDIAVTGEGERAFLDILEAHRLKIDRGQVAGICYVDEKGAFCQNVAMQRIREIDEIPWPKWPEGYLETFWAKGKSYGVHTVRDMPILGSRGCPYQCTFCSNPTMWTTRYILRDVDDLIEEIKSYKERYDISAIQFFDLTAITKKRWVLEFGKKMKEAGLDLMWSLPSGTRSEVLDEETLTLLRETRCNYLVYAPESGSPNTLKIVKKRIELDRITESMKTAKKVGLTIRANLIIGFPHESRGDIFRTILYGLRLSAIGVDEVPLFIFSAYPGNEIFRGLVAEGRLEVDDDYLFGLTSLNSDFGDFRPLVFTTKVSATELGIYRTGFMMLNYLIGYLFFPSRIFRTIKNVFGGGSHEAATVFEHRIRNALDRKKDDADSTETKESSATSGSRA